MHRFFMSLSRAMAIVGGITLSALVAIVVVSILGREGNAILHADFFKSHFTGLADWLLKTGLPGPWGRIRVGPITGDYELVEAGVAFAIFSFLPLAQITGAHAVVDIFTNWLGERAQKVLVAVIEVAFALTLIIIAYQLLQGELSKHHSHQTTFLLQFPVWWSYAASTFAAAVAALVAVYTALVRVWEAVSGRHVLTEPTGADH